MGVLDGPIMLTGSLNVARVADAVITETIRLHPEVGEGKRFVHPFVAECSDAYFSDLGARPIGATETVAAWREAAGGPVPEGSVGAGTGLVSFELKAGIGTASRLAPAGAEEYVVGVLVSSNTGLREQLVVDGVPVGRELDVARPSWAQQGSIVVVVATDAPLGPRQLGRLAKRSFLGLARTGAAAHNGSGDFAVAFSTARRVALDESLHTALELDNEVVVAALRRCLRGDRRGDLERPLRGRRLHGPRGKLGTGASPRRSGRTPGPPRTDPDSVVSALSPTLAINEAVLRRRALGERIVHLGFGEAGLPVHSLLREALERASGSNAYGAVAGSGALGPASPATTPGAG